jgi:hypothetical protein
MQPESFIIFTNFLIGLIMRAVKLDSPGIVKVGCLLREWTYYQRYQQKNYDKRVIIHK